MDNKYQFIKVDHTETKESANNIWGELYCRGYREVGIVYSEDKGYDVIIYPGTRPDLESIMDCLLISGFKNATLIK